MGKEKKNFIWNIIGLSFNSFLSFFLLIAVKRINGLDIAGIFTYAFSLCSLFIIIGSYYSRTFQVSDYKREYSLNDYFTFRFIFSIITFILLVGFSFINGFDRYKISVIMLLMGYRCIESLSDSLFGQMQIEGNLYKTGISYTLKALIGFIAFVIIDLFTNNLLLSITGLVLVYLIVLLTYDLSSVENKLTKIKLNKDKFIKLMLVTFPIFIYTFLQNYLSNSQKMVMTYFVSNEFQTIFGILIMPATMLLLVGNYIIMPFLNDLTDKFKNKDIKGFDKIVNKICITIFLIGILCVVAAYFLGIPVLNIIYSIKLDEYRIMLIIVLVGAIFNSIIMILTNILTILTINKKQTYIYLFMSIVSTLITVALANYYKIQGLCYSYTITYILLFIIYYIVYKRQIKKIGK